MKTLFILICVCSFSFCSAQESQNLQIFYLKNSGKYVSVNQRDSADYIRVVTAPDSGSKLYNISEFYQGGKKKLIGTSLTLDPPSFDGPLVRYYKNGKRQSNERFSNGFHAGRQFEFYPNGKVYLVKDYPEINPTANNVSFTFTIAENYDSLGTAKVMNGNGYYKGYNRDFTTVEEEGKVKDGVRDSVWKGTNAVSKGTFVEKYDHGVLINGSALFIDGTTATYKERETPPQFKGGLIKFGNYLSDHINYPFYERKNNIQGKVIISFVVEKDGHVTDVKVIRSVSPGLDEEASRVITKSPKWLPGVYFGKPARVAYSVPISFALSR